MDDKRLDRIEEKIDTLITRASSIDTTLAKQHVSLKSHMRRTELLEGQVLPLVRRMNMLEGALKLLALIASLAGLYEIVKAFR